MTSTNTHSRWRNSSNSIKPLLILPPTLLFAALLLGSLHNPNFWSTQNQRAQKLQNANRLPEAARLYTDPMRQGAALYKNGDFKEAAAAFAHASGAEGAYNQANALLMHGDYDSAIKSYDRALALKPDWKNAQDNKALAIARRDKIHNVPDDGTGGQEKPDQIVIDNKAHGERAHEVQLNTGKPLSDQELQAQWLRRVQTKPADFLRAKFASQLQQEGSQP